MLKQEKGELIFISNRVLMKFFSKVLHIVQVCISRILAYRAVIRHVTINVPGNPIS